MQVNKDYMNMLVDVNILRSSINTARDMFDAAAAFTESVNNGEYFSEIGYTGVEEIYNQLTTLNNTLMSLEQDATNSFNNLTRSHISIVAALNTLSMLQVNYSLAEDDISMAYNDSQVASTLIEMTTSFAGNISLIVGTLKSVEGNINTLENGTMVANESVQILNEDFVSLNNTLMNLTSQLTVLSNLAYNLNASSYNIRSEALLNLKSVQSLMVSYLLMTLSIYCNGLGCYKSSFV